MPVMKNYIFLFLFLLLIQSSFSQDVATLIKLHELSVNLGIKNSISIDTMLINSRNEKINRRVSEQQLLLLKASEYYLNGDYENSLFFIKQAEIRFRNNDLNNLKYFVYIGSCAHLNLPVEAAKFYYIANNTDCIDPVNMIAIKNEIKNTISKELFERGLSRYYYYHKRMNILEDIYN
jgi:hypothetical protein